MEATLTEARTLRGFAYRRFAAAAALVAGVVGFASWDRLRTIDPASLASGLTPAAERIVETGVGALKLVHLADGSTVMLNTDSRLRVGALDGLLAVESLHNVGLRARLIGVSARRNEADWSGKRSQQFPDERAVSPPSSDEHPRR